MSLDVVAQFTCVDAFDGAESAYGHKYRSEHVAMGGAYDTGARGTIAVSGNELKIH